MLCYFDRCYQLAHHSASIIPRFSLKRSSLRSPFFGDSVSNLLAGNLVPCIHSTFDDHIVVSQMEPGLLPFTSPDWFLGKGVRRKLLETMKKGLKFHPVYEPINLNSPLVDKALKDWQETDLPVISYCGVNS